MGITEAVFFSAALSMDAFGIGASCSMRDIRFPLLQKLIICMISVVVTGAAVFSGDLLSSFLDPLVCRAAGAVMLAILGGYIAAGVFRDDNDTDENEHDTGIIEATARILHDPASCDMDNSGFLSIREACFLGAALSADSFAAGLGAGIGGGAFAVPFFCGAFQLILLCAGEFIGRRLCRKTKYSGKYFTLASGALLIIIAFLRLFA